MNSHGSMDPSTLITQNIIMIWIKNTQIKKNYETPFWICINHFSTATEYYYVLDSPEQIEVLLNGGGTGGENKTRD